MTRTMVILGRKLRNRPFAAVAAVVCLGLSFALAGVLFAFVDGRLLRPLPFDPHDRLLAVDYKRQGLLLPDLAYGPDRLADRNALRDRLAASPLIDGSTQAEGAVYFDRDQAAGEGLVVTGADSSFFSLFDLTPDIGRTFGPSDALSPSVLDRNSPVPLPVLISSDLATRLGRITALGRTELAGRPVEVVGVLPLRTKFPGETNVWAPVPIERDRPPRYVRLRSGASVEELAAQFPELQFTRLRDEVRGTPDYAIVCLLVATLALVLLAWVQVTSIVGVDGEKDEREALTKVSLGANWRQVATPWIVEHTAVALAALCLATPLVWPGAAALEGFLPTQWAHGQYLAPDGRTVAFLLALFVAAVLAFSVGAVRRARKVAGMWSGGVGVSDRPRRATDRILGIQFGVTAFLLYLLGLAASSYISMTRTNVGFDLHQTVVFSPPPWAGLEPDLVRLRDAFERHNERIRQSVHTLNAMPEVIRAAVLQTAPFDVGLDQQRLNIDQFDGRSLRGVTARINHVGAGFVEAIGATVVVGQDLSAPSAAGREVALVNESLARALAPGAVGRDVNLVPSVVGRELRTGPLRAEVAGVIRDFVDSDLARSADPQVFFVNKNDAGNAVAIRLREPTTLSGARVRARLEAIWGHLPSTRLRTLDAERTGDLAVHRSAAVLLTIVALCCLPIATMGVAGALMRAVKAQAHQIAVRMALGADAPGVSRMVGTWAVRSAGVGVAGGIGLAILSGGLLQSLLFGVEVLDAVVVVTVSVGMIVFAWMCALIPARSAAAIDPGVLLKSGQGTGLTGL